MSSKTDIKKPGATAAAISNIAGNMWRLMKQWEKYWETFIFN